MGFREKIAWVSLGAMIPAYGVYFGTILAAGDEAQGAVTPESLWMLWLFAGVTAAQAGAISLMGVVLAIRAGRDSRRAADERERAITRRGSAVAYHVLLAGTILVGVVMPFEASGWRLINAALFVLVLGEFTRHAVVLFSYRRGWHG